jgi:hypothetical protein
LVHPGYHDGRHHLRSVEGDLPKIADTKYDLKYKIGKAVERTTDEGVW